MAYRGEYSRSDRTDRSEGDQASSMLGGSAEEGDKPTYLMEHLATFTVTKETGIMYPADGMRRLLQLEKSNGIWSQKMQLCLDRSWVLIMDYETGSVMERFPASMIKEPTAFTSIDPMEIYNNILVFIVGGTGSGSGYGSRSEMHIFQCQNISAQDLVEDLRDLQAGKMITRNRKRSLAASPVQSPNPTNSRQEENFANYRECDSDIIDDGSSTSSEKYEHDVTILNHCFDDIEKFIARLQHAAAASRELDRRRKSRKSKKRDLGDGLLAMRMKPPPERDFIDIFQKFKLSFNLLAKLRAHIHDPNAPELVHFLFTPLALIVDASHDTLYDPNLPAKVVSPLLTREAVNLLLHCVTSKETELWQSLGNAWVTPRDQWKGAVPSYHPVFMDGWSPDYPVIDEQESVYSRKPGQESHRDYGNEYYPYEPAADHSRYMYEGQHNEPEHEMQHLSLQDTSAHSDISLDSIERNGGDERAPPDYSQEAWLEDLQSRGAKIVQVTYPRTANNEKELTVVRGEYLEVMDNSRKWWKARNIHGKIAHVPHTIVTSHLTAANSESNEIFNNPLYSRNVSRNMQNQDPGNFGAASSLDHSPSVVSTAPADKVRKEHLGEPTERFAGPPPPPPPPPVENHVKQPSTLRSIKSDIRKTPQTPDGMQDELKNVLTMYRQRKPNWDIMKTPEVFIRQTSTPSEVQKWLQAKSFSDSICAKLKGLSGNEMFSLTRQVFEEKLGQAEGKRLYSQITIQRNVSGFKTARSSELQAILALARQKADSGDT